MSQSQRSLQPPLFPSGPSQATRWGQRSGEGEGSACSLAPHPFFRASRRNLDFISLMAYDFHGSWERTTGHNSPLYRRQGESGAAAELNVVSGRGDEVAGG